MSYGYDDEVLLPVTIQVPADLPSGSPVQLRARADWLECKEICLPGKADVEITLPVAAAAGAPSDAAPLFARTRGHLPRDGAPWRVRALAAEKRLVLAFVPAVTVQEAYFFSEHPQVVEYAEPQQLLRTSEGFSLEMTPALNGPRPQRLVGVLVAETGDGAHAVTIDAALEAVTAAPAGTEVARAARSACWGRWESPSWGRAAPQPHAVRLPGALDQGPRLRPPRAASRADARRHGLAFAAGVVAARSGRSPASCSRCAPAARRSAGASSCSRRRRGRALACCSC